MVTQLNISFDNCFGINRLRHRFELAAHKTHSIYAPNGSMKSSFANAIQEYVEGRPARDRIYPAKVSAMKFAEHDGTLVDPKTFVVLKPYDEGDKTGRISTLLVDDAARTRYTEIAQQIEDARSALFRRLKAVSRIGSNEFAETEIKIAFGNRDLMEILHEENARLDACETPFKGFQYRSIFDRPVLDLLVKPEIQEKIESYIEKYQELITLSPYLNQTFNHSQADTTRKHLGQNGFFDANHRVRLFDGDGYGENLTAEQFKEVIDGEVEKVLADADLAARFNEIDRLLTNARMRDFRNLVFEHRDLLTELYDIHAFRIKVWRSYFCESKLEIAALLSARDDNRDEMEEIVRKAKEQKDEWLKVVEIFNRRFFVPFEAIIENQEDIILKRHTPRVSFSFQDRPANERVSVTKSQLLQVLSQGERKALYILNAIFEIEHRRKMGMRTVFVVDDIADSFDYRNKFAIIEYLKDISDEGGFSLILLTHNFDFHRTVSSRLRIRNDAKLYVVKSDTEIKLINDRYDQNPFNSWKKEMHRSEGILIACIPFVRNLSEYCGRHTDFQKLTSLLHIKSSTRLIKVSHLQKIFRRVLQGAPTMSLPRQNDKVVDVIYDAADNILAGANESIDLEEKIVLAIAIRLVAEEFMIRELMLKFGNDNFLSGITRNQTNALTRLYLQEFPGNVDEKGFLDLVSLMTPENIHLNSFMYEPILDMSSLHLKELYNRAKTM